MTNDEWCRTVLEKVFPKETIPTSQLSPALNNIAGQIWRDWQQMKGFSGPVDVAAHNLPYGAPPDFKWVGKILVSASWRIFAGEQAFDPWFRTRCLTKYGPEFRLATGSGGLSLEGLLKL